MIRSHAEHESDTTGDDMSKTSRTLWLGFVVAACALPLAATAQGPDPDGVRITPDVVYGHKDGMALTFDVLQPQNPNGAAVLYMVSGGWVSRWSPPEQLASRTFAGLLEEGFTVLPIRHGSSPRYKVPEAEADVRRALRYVQMHADELGVDPDRIGVFGGSAGGHLSLMLGLASHDEGRDGDELRSPNRVAAVVAYYPPVDLQPLTGPSDRFPALDFPQTQAAAISPILFVSRDDPPTLLIHGDADALVNVSNSERIYEALQTEGVESKLIIIPGGDHGFRRAEDRAQAQEAMVAWFVLQLGDSPRSSANTQAPDLVGSWHLDSWTLANGNPRCSEEEGGSSGIIVYTDDGHMSAQLGCAGLDTGDLSSLSPQAAAGQLSRRHFSYYGRYTLDRSAKTVTHHVEGSSSQPFVGSDQVRWFVFEGPDRLVLSTDEAGRQLLVWLRNR